MPSPSSKWPVLTRYEGRALDRLRLPLGGIGTGTVGLGGRGDLNDWEIQNRPAKNSAPPVAFFAFRCESPTTGAVTRVLEGPIPPALYEGGLGSPVPHAGLPRFDASTFAVAYPLAQLAFTDPRVPCTVTLEAFNPLCPPDPDASGWPLAVLRYRIANPTTEVVSVSLCGSVSNIVGSDQPGLIRTNSVLRQDGLTGIVMTSTAADALDEKAGSMCISVLDEGLQVSTRLQWRDRTWGDSLLDFWEDFAADGALHGSTESHATTRGRPSEASRNPVASLATSFSLQPGEERSVTFLLTWHFANRRAWTPAGMSSPEGAYTEDVIGNYYTSQHEDAWGVARAASKGLGELEARTVDFVSTLCSSSLPHSFAEAALYNLSTLRTETCFRTADGRFYGWEGIFDQVGSCLGSCTHVWNYDQATPFLFGSLARSMREVEFAFSTNDVGLMSCRTLLPLVTHAQAFPLAAADGQMGCIIKLYRDWQLSADDVMLRALWPHARRALEFCWVPGGWDADRDGVMEGAQHNTMDVEFYGPSSWMNTWYLGALRAAAKMATHVGDDAFADRCASLAAEGAAWVDAHLFNGEYYEQQVQPPGDFARIAPGLRHGELGSDDPADPDFQLGAGCALDQLGGQFVAYAAGLGDLMSGANMSATVNSIMRYNFREDFSGHFNHLRSFVLGHDSGLVMASYPGDRPARPFPYFNEVMTGFEYGLATTALYLGHHEQALKVVAAVRARFDGEHRNPFDEAECGHHYARAMASWGLVNAAAGFSYSAVERVVNLLSRPNGSRWLWCSGNAWGELTWIAPSSVDIVVHAGHVTVDEVWLDGNPMSEGTATVREAEGWQ